MFVRYMSERTDMARRDNSGVITENTMIGLLNVERVFLVCETLMLMQNCTVFLRKSPAENDGL